MNSALYRGEVTHRRTRPREHRLRYRVFWMLLDLDEIDALAARLHVFSRNRFNLFGFHDADFGDGSDRPLREQVTALLEGQGVGIGRGAVRLLTMPRMLGFVFNPISLYYCHAEDGRLAAVVYEVSSTFGERRAYVMPVADGDAARGRFRQATAKALHVSPFMGMDMRYDFRGHAPGGRVDLAIEGSDRDGLLIFAALNGQRHDLTDGALIRVGMAMPLMTMKVVAAIHWEALKLWLKGAPLFPAPHGRERQDTSGSRA